MREVAQILANPVPQGTSFPSPASSPRGLRPAREAPSLLRFWHLTSLDAPTVAVIWSLVFAWTAHVRLPAWSPLLLALVAWTVYIVDRLLDARAGLRTPSLHQLRERHHFHWRHRRVFAPLAAAAAVIAASMVLALLPARALKPDSLVAVATLAYFSGVHSRIRFPSHLAPFFSREFLVGALFTAGCALPTWCRIPLSQSSWALFHALAVPVVFFAALAWLNCRAIGSWESESPQTRSADGTGPSSNRIFPIASFLALTGSSTAVALYASSHPRSALMLATGASSALLLAGLDLVRSRFKPLLLRSAADLALLTPALLLPFTIR
jgi:hypothetical protein